jgi:hypothetical protein
MRSRRVLREPSGAVFAHVSNPPGPPRLTLGWASRAWRSADFSIADIRVADRDAGTGLQSSARERGTSPLIEFLHWPAGQEPVSMNAAYEASGTYRLSALLGPLLATIDRGKLLVIDSSAPPCIRSSRASASRSSSTHRSQVTARRYYSQARTPPGWTSIACGAMRFGWSNSTKHTPAP